ncbi:MAG: efflux RND transporter permease subunit, partial [Myxococcota bacterium]
MKGPSTLLDAIFDKARVVLTVAALLALSGLLAWQTMPRQEDPTMPYRFGLITVVYPGADPLDVERLVVEPLEDRLAEVEGIKEVEATARAGVATLVVGLTDAVGFEDTDAVWQDVRDAIELGRGDLPEGAMDPVLDDERFDQDSIVIAITGSGSTLELAQSAELLRERLLRVPTVKRVNTFGDPGEQVTVALDDAAARRYGTSSVAILGQLSSRNVTTPGGSLLIGERKVLVRPRADFSSLDELRATPILVGSGASVPLGELARVGYGPTEPRAGVMRLDGEAVVAVGVVPRASIDMTAFGEDVRAELERASSLIAPHSTRVVFEQPRRLQDRLRELSTSLLQGTLIVAIVLVLFMGVRLGLLVAVVVPLVASISLAVYSWAGGVLHQMSIAALVIALGLLVDNAIVMAESIQLELDRGASRRDALRRAVRQLAWPLGTATGTTLAAFVPMLLAEGATGDFTRAIPVVVMWTLVVSYIFAVLVTPVMAGMSLKPRTQSDMGGAFQKIGRLLGAFAVRSPWRTLIIVAAMVVSAVALLPRVPLQFFPLADRDQLFIELELPEGTHVDRTDRITARLEAALAEHEAVVERSAYVGQGVPRFYYNVT